MGRVLAWLCRPLLPKLEGLELARLRNRIGALEAVNARLLEAMSTSGVARTHMELDAAKQSIEQLREELAFALRDRDDARTHAEIYKKLIEADDDQADAAPVAT